MAEPESSSILWSTEGSKSQLPCGGNGNEAGPGAAVEERGNWGSQMGLGMRVSQLSGCIAPVTVR